ncbi:FAD/NAD(P)-binding oxidoreductase [Nocardioides korecus]
MAGPDGPEGADPPGHLVVVGASLAGVRAAESARKAGHTGPITLVGAEDELPYDRPPLSKQVLAQDGPSDPTHHRTADQLAELDVEVRLGTRATALDTGARTVTLAREDGDEQAAYDVLVVATGATARRLDVPVEGQDVTAPLPRGVTTLRTLTDARTVRSALDSEARTVVVGAGFIGLEVATAVLARGRSVTVVEAAERPLARAVGPDAADLLVALVRDAGADLRTGTGVDRLRAADGHVTEVVLADGTTLPADLVVTGVGAVPATGWLDGSGLELEDGVVTDATLTTSVPGVLAAGDVARVRHGDHDRRVEHWTAAAEEGALAGANAVAHLRGDDPRALATVPYFWSELFGSKVQMLGEAHGADRSEVLGGPDGPWLVLLGRDDRLTGVLSRDLPGRIMKFRPLLAAGASYADGLALARNKPLPT